MDNRPQHQYIGKPYPIHDALEKVTGAAVYTADMRPAGMLHAKMLFSPHAHARILSIDTSAAEAAPGVRFVACCENTPDKVFNSAQRFKGHNMKPDEQVFPRHLRYAGDRVAAVVADTEAAAEAALKLIKVEYEVLPFVLEIEDALQPGAPAIHDGGNLLGEMQVEAGDPDEGFEASDFVFEGRYTTPVVHHYAMEPHAALADYDGRHLTVWTSTQNLFAFRVLLSEIYDLPVNRIRLIRPTAGGGFGGKYEMVLESVVAWLAINCKKPVMLELSRRDSIISTRTRHGAVVYMKVGVQKDGTINAIQYRELAGAGAYAGSTMNVLGGASAKAMMLYRAPHIRFTGLGVYTNTPVAGAMRGYGSPQVETPLELHIDKIARAMGLDPVEFRMKNLVVPGDINPAKKTSLGNCRAKECLQRAAELIGWTDAVTISPDGKKRRAMGIASGVHGNGVAGVMMDTTTIHLKMTEDGSLLLFTGTQDIGQGNIMVLRQIVGEALKTDPVGIEFVEADTTLTPFDMGTFSSRCTWVAGQAARGAALEMLKELQREAAEVLGCAQEALEHIENGFCLKTDATKRVCYGALAIHAQQVSERGEFYARHTHYSKHNPGSYAAHIAEVEVDTETFEVQVLRYAAVHDVGQAVNPLMLEGQIEGGIQMGLGYGLSEELVMDPETGKVTNALTKKYGIWRAAKMPKMLIDTVEYGEEHGPYGAKSIGEIATVPVGAALVNAVNHALDIHITDLPATPQRIKAAWAEQHQP